MTNNIAIVGGSGFIGTRLCERLSKIDSIKFSILDIQKSAKYPEHWEYADLRDLTTLQSTLKGFDTVINLAAEHKDNISPVSKYYETNVEGQKNLCQAMDQHNIKSFIFTSSVAVYGFVTEDTGEDGKINPFHEYGDSKYKAELAAEEWFCAGKQLSIIRPTVVFGEGNKGNVYNLLKQIASGKFLMIGTGDNKKSMAYVENVAAFIEHLVKHGSGHQIFNYIDKPDFNMNELAKTVTTAIDKPLVNFKVPYVVGLIAGYSFDTLSQITRREFPISSIRIKKFCAKTQFKSNTNYLEFEKPVSLEEGLTKTVNHEFK